MSRGSTNTVRRRIIIITGTPGVGKHTVAKTLAQMTHDKYIVIDVNESARKAGLYEHNQDVINVDTEKLVHTIKQDIKNPASYIVVGHLAPYAIRPSKDVVFTAVLRRNPYELLKVYKERKYSHAKSCENAGAEVLGVIAHDVFCSSYAKTGQFDTTNSNANQIAKSIRDAMWGKKIPWKPIDWLHDEGAPRMLEDFFPDWPQFSNK